MQVPVDVASKLFRVGLICFLVLLMFGCKPKNQSELYGTYIADYDIAKEKLTLNKDGTFVQEVTLKAISKIDVME